MGLSSYPLAYERETTRCSARSIDALHAHKALNPELQLLRSMLCRRPHKKGVKTLKKKAGEGTQTNAANNNASQPEGANSTEGKR